MAAPAPNRPLVDRYAGMRRYFRRWNKVERWKWGLSAVALVVGLGWLAAGPIGTLLKRPGMDERYSHGPLANPHAAWESKCEVCHRTHSPGDDSWNFLNARGRWTDLTCETCHAGPAHHGGTTEENAKSCANCHHDHQGRNVSLTRISNDHCTSCHATGRLSITHFTTDHPEFQALKEEPEGKPHQRSMKFSHALHMAPGLSIANDPKLDRAALRQDTHTSDPSLVQLSCGSCHQLDAQRHSLEGLFFRRDYDWPRESVQPPRAEGATFLPINFEAHCQSCHPLGIIGEGKDGSPGIKVPHRQSPSEIKKLVEAAVGLELGKTAKDLPALPFMRQQPDRSTPDNPEASRFDSAVSGRFTIVEANCRKCHDLEKKGKMGFGSPRETIPVEMMISPVRIPTVWFESAKFNHASHRGTACSACHTNPDMLVNGKLNEREKINLPGIDNCRQCHAPAGGTPDKPVGGIRFNCTDCHNYHNGDHGLQGRGAAARNPLHPKKDPIEFLLGKPNPPPDKP